jgi:hypothetical protein
MNVPLSGHPSLAQGEVMANHRDQLFLRSAVLLTLIFLLIPLLHALPDARTKSDIVYLANGDKITCEVKSLSKGQLSVKPDYTSGNVIIDWTKVARIESSQQFIITDPNGNLSYGGLTGDPEAHTVTVVRSSRTTLPHDSVVQIAELGASFIKRMRGDISVGTTFAQSNSQSTLAVQSNVTYQSVKYVDTVSWNSQFASQQKTSNTAETTVKSSVFRELRRSNWYGGGIANFLSSSEQQISLQSTFGGAIARRLIFNNHTNLSAIGGIGLTLQKNSPGAVQTGRTTNIDSAFAVQYSTFRFDSTNFDTSLWVYPSLTEPGRVRMTLNQDVYYKFLGNLYISFNFFDNYDSHPVVGAPANNLGASTQVGWSFP